MRGHRSVALATLLLLASSASAKQKVPLPSDEVLDAMVSFIKDTSQPSASADCSCGCGSPEYLQNARSFIVRRSVPEPWSHVCSSHPRFGRKPSFERRSPGGACVATGDGSRA